MREPGGGVVTAAGAVPWRRGAGGGLEVLLVRSARYDEWGWPKGKPEPVPYAGGTEPLPEAAVREVAEESGLVVRLGAPLPSVEYVTPDGWPKRVSYWVGRPVAEGDPTAAQDEIDGTAWLPVDQARARLSRPGDEPPLQQLVHLARHGRLDTRALVVARHAKAVPRRRWHDDEADRPLDRRGLAQAAAMAPLLRCWRPDRLLTSPWTRCVQTLEPYRERHGGTLEELPELTEAAVVADPAAAADVLVRMLGAGEDAVLCTHRPVLAVLLRVLREAAGSAALPFLPRRDPWLAKGELLVLHLAAGTGGAHTVHAVERHPPEGSPPG